MWIETSEALFYALTYLYPGYIWLRVHQYCIPHDSDSHEYSLILKCVVLSFINNIIWLSPGNLPTELSQFHHPLITMVLSPVAFGLITSITCNFDAPKRLAKAVHSIRNNARQVQSMSEYADAQKDEQAEPVACTSGLEHSTLATTITGTVSVRAASMQPKLSILSKFYIAMHSVLNWCNVKSIGPRASSWDWAFHNAEPQYVVVTLKNGNTILGGYTQNSHAGSSPAERHLFLDQVYRLGRDSQWEPVPRSGGVFISASEISVVEFIRNE